MPCCASEAGLRHSKAKHKHVLCLPASLASHPLGLLPAKQALLPAKQGRQVLRIHIDVYFSIQNATVIAKKLQTTTTEVLFMNDRLMQKDKHQTCAYAQRSKN